MAIKIFIDQGHNPVNPNAGAEGNGKRVFSASLFYTGYGIRNAAFFVCFRGVGESPISCGFGERLK